MSIYHKALSSFQQLALDTLLGRETDGIPVWIVHIMEWDMIERIAGVPPGTYPDKPHETYLAMARAAGVCQIDQYIPENPLKMGPRGYESDSDMKHKASMGAPCIELDGMRIAEPEDVLAHLEQVEWPRMQQQVDDFDEDATVNKIIDSWHGQQNLFDPDILKTGYGIVGFPGFRYTRYGYVNYFTAYALYPEVMEEDFRRQGDLALRRNRAAARAYREGRLPPLHRLDSDMADSRGMLVDIKSLDKLWLPHFARSLAPMLKTDVKMIWHSDGNLMDMYPRLLDVGIRGFQGFQYEDGMDYEKICKMKARDGDDLYIIAGVSVTRTLPLGTPSDVKREIDFLVEKGPRRGLCLGCSSSVAPGVPWENLKTMIEGFRHYREHGRKGL